MDVLLLHMGPSATSPPQMSVLQPDYDEGIKYWSEQAASLDGVLGGLSSLKNFFEHIVIFVQVDMVLV